MSTTPTTYTELLNIQERLVQQGALKPQTAANRASTLRAFLKLNNLELDDPVGHEFRASFNAHCQAFAEHMAKQGRESRNVSNSLSTLRPWRKFVVALDTERAIAGDNLPPFNQAFRSVLKDVPVKRLGRQLQIPSGMIYGWLKGKKPHLSNAPHIHRIESFFGLEHGELSVLAGFSGTSRIPQTVGEAVAVSYRESLGERTSQHYFFKPGPDSQLRFQWCDFIRYKTDWEPTLNRSDSAVWRALATLTWRADNNGQLYQRPDGSWWIRIDGENFKNVRGAAGEGVYDMPVQEMAWGDLERYIKVFRPRLVTGNTDFLFVAAGHASRRRDCAIPWTDLSERVSALTKKYLWRCPGIGTHAFRHLVATAIIKASNLSDFKTAALVLNDRMSTVEKNYAHLRSSDGANRMSDLLGHTFRRM